MDPDTLITEAWAYILGARGGGGPHIGHEWKGYGREAMNHPSSPNAKVRSSCRTAAAPSTSSALGLHCGCCYIHLNFPGFRMSSLAEVRLTTFMSSQGLLTLAFQAMQFFSQGFCGSNGVVARCIMPLRCTGTHGPGATVINQPVPATQASMHQR